MSVDNPFPSPDDDQEYDAQGVPIIGYDDDGEPMYDFSYYDEGALEFERYRTMVDVMIYDFYNDDSFYDEVDEEQSNETSEDPLSPVLAVGKLASDEQLAELREKLIPQESMLPRTDIPLSDALLALRKKLRGETDGSDSE